MAEREPRRLSRAELLELGRWTTPAIYNGWEQITARDPGRDGFNREPCRDFMPGLGPMIGYAVTVVIEPSQPSHKRGRPNAWSDYRRHVASVPGPKIVVVQDLDKPNVHGAFWGEVNSTIHRALDCVGTITDGSIRDLEEMRQVGFKAIARSLGVGHAYVTPIRWNCEVEVFGRVIEPGQLIHADRHGFLAIPAGEEAALLEASRFMETAERRTIIAAARDTLGKTTEEILASLDAARGGGAPRVRERFGREGEG